MIRAAACAPRRCGNCCASARSARPNSGRPELRSGRTSRFRCGSSLLSESGRAGRDFAIAARSVPVQTSLLSERSRLTTSPPPAAGAGFVDFGARACAGFASAGRGSCVRCADLPAPRQLVRRRLAFDGFELEAELHRRIEEAVIASNGTVNALGHAAERQADLEGIVGTTTRSQNWCWRTMVMACGYCARIRSDSRTPGARVANVILKWCSPGRPFLAASASTVRTTPRKAAWARMS